MSLRRSTRSTLNTRDARITCLDEGSKKVFKTSRKRNFNDLSPSSQETRGFRAPPQPSERPQHSVNEDHSLLQNSQKSVADTASAVAHSAGDIDRATSPLASRTTDPSATNLPVITSDDRPKKAIVPDLPRSLFTLSAPNMESHSFETTSTILSRACTHLLSVEPKLDSLIRNHPCHVFSPAGLSEKIDPFRSLVSGILAQQISGAAARAIIDRFTALFNGNSSPQPQFPRPVQVATTEITRLRSAGLSQRKAEYVQGLAAKFDSGELSTRMLLQSSDEEIMEKLIAVRGLGRWSVEMFACFCLKRMDVFSTGDLGVQRGMAAFMGKDVRKLKNKGGKWKYISERDMLEASEKFKPYRSLFMWYMWKVEDVDVTAVQGQSETQKS